MTTRFLSIGEAAAASGLSAHTLRYYEQIGLIAPIARHGGGARRYGPEDMRWLEFLVHLRATGMPMRDMHRYAQSLRAGRAPERLAERQALLEEHAQRVTADLRSLEDMLARLREKIRGYQAMQAPARRA
jgi:DNA-binding transcriptional MerR regulator